MAALALVLALAVVLAVVLVLAVAVAVGWLGLARQGGGGGAHQADGGADPGAVVVEALDAVVVDAAVVRARRLVEVASVVVAHSHLLAVAQGHHLGPGAERQVMGLAERQAGGAPAWRAERWPGPRRRALARRRQQAGEAAAAAERPQPCRQPALPPVLGCRPGGRWWRAAGSGPPRGAPGLAAVQPLRVGRLPGQDAGVGAARAGQPHERGDWKDDAAGAGAGAGLVSRRDCRRAAARCRHARAGAGARRRPEAPRRRRRAAGGGRRNRARAPDDQQHQLHARGQVGRDEVAEDRRRDGDQEPAAQAGAPVGSDHDVSPAAEELRAGGRAAA
jgi:hypothetical protein